MRATLALNGLILVTKLEKIHYIIDLFSKTKTQERGRNKFFSKSCQKLVDLKNRKLGLFQNRKLCRKDRFKFLNFLLLIAQELKLWLRVYFAKRVFHFFFFFFLKTRYLTYICCINNGCVGRT